MPHITENMWKDHLASIAAGKMDSRKAARSLGCSMRAVQKRMEAAGIKAIDPTPPPPPAPKPAAKPPSPASPEVASPDAKGKSDLERALDAAKPQGGPGAVVPSPGDIAGAADRMAGFCVDTLNTIKGVSLTALAQYHYKVDPGEPRIQAQMRLGLPAETAVRTNADKLYPYLFRLMSGWGPVCAWLAMDLLTSQAAVKTVAIERGWKPRERKADPPAADPPAAAAAPATKVSSPVSPPPPDVKPVAVVIPGVTG